MQPKKRKWRWIVLLSGLFIFITWAAGEWFQQQEVIRAQQEELAKVEQEVEEARLQQLELNRKVDQLHDPEHIAEIARKQYFLSRDGEMIFNVTE